MSLQEYKEEFPVIMAIIIFAIILSVTFGLYMNDKQNQNVNSVEMWKIIDFDSERNDSDSGESPRSFNASVSANTSTSAILSAPGKSRSSNTDGYIVRYSIKTASGSSITINESDPVLKEIYLRWMKSVSNEKQTILEMIYDEVSKYPLKDLLLAIIYNETWPKFNPWSYSRAGAICLMQVNPSVWTERLKRKGIIKKKSELWRIDKCIEAGDYILNFYLIRYNGNVRKALIAYVGGDKKYADNVLKTLGEISALKMIALANMGKENLISSPGKIAMSQEY